MHFAHHCGHDVAGLQIKVVAWPVQVGGHDSNEVCAVLQVKTLTHLQASDLGDGVGLVSVLQRRGDEVSKAFSPMG